MYHRHPYYIGIAHTTNLRNRTVRLRGHGNYTRQTRRVYRAHAVVLRVDPRRREEVRPGEESGDPREEFRVVYVSDPLKVHPHIHDMYKGRRFWNVVEDRSIPSFVCNLIYLIFRAAMPTPYVLLMVYRIDLWGR